MSFFRGDFLRGNFLRGNFLRGLIQGFMAMEMLDIAE